MTKIIRPIRVCGDVAYVPLTQGYEAIIDLDNITLVEGRNWFASHNGRNVYAQRTDRSGKKLRTIYLHRLIMGDPYKLGVDHKDGNGLNNMRCNLRVSTHAQNMQNQRTRCDNTSGFKGVGFNKQCCKFMAKIKFDKKTNYLGLFDSAEEAFAAYCAASDKFHGEFGRTE
jgi:hypothetical protein